MRPALILLLCGIISSGFLPDSTRAQQRVGSNTPDRIFSGTSLSETILSVAEYHGVDVVFDPDLVEGYTVFYRMREEPVQETLRNILQGSDLDFIILSSGTFVIVRSPVDTPRYGSMQGRIIDSESGMPLPNAHVYLADASRGTSTNRGGQFNLHRLMPGTHRIIFSYLGYEPVELEFTIPSNGQLDSTIELTPDPVQTNPIVVTAHQPVLPRSTTRGETETLRLWSTDGRQSPIQLLHLFPGIHSGTAGGAIHLQGSPSSDHRTYLDGAPVYHPYSMGRHMSAFSPYAVHRITLQRAGYGMEHGSQLAGRVDLQHDLSSNRTERMTLQSDPVYANLTLQTGRSERQPWSVMAALRTSLWNLFQDPSLRSNLNEWDFVDPLTLGALQGHTDVSRYEPVHRERQIGSQDIHLAGRFEPSPYRSHTLSLYIGSNELSNQLLNRMSDANRSDRLFTAEQYRWDNGMVQSSLDWLLTPRLDWESQWSVSWVRSRSRYGWMDESELPLANEDDGTGSMTFPGETLSPSRAQENRNRLTHLMWNQRIRYAANETLDWIAGLETHWIHSDFAFNDLYFRASSVSEQMGQMTIRTGAEWSPASHWVIEGGTRWSWILPSGSFYAEPRLSIQLDRPDARPGPTSYKLSGGLYRQFVHSFDLANPGPSSLVPDATLWSLDTRSRVPISWHTSVSIRSEVTPTSVFLMESYLKLQPHGWITSYHRLMADPDAPRDRIETFAESGSSRSAGLSLQWRQSLIQNRLHIWSGYDWSWTRMDMPHPYNRELPAPWNVPHQVQFRVMVRPVEAHTLRVNWTSRSGRRWAFRNSYYDLLLPHDIRSAGSFSFSTPENDRIPAHHQLDLGWIYRPTQLAPHLELRIDLIHLAGNRQILDRSLLPEPVDADPASYQIVERTGPGFTPTFSVQLQF